MTERRKPGLRQTERHIIFLDELRRHSDREVCMGAADYSAEHPGWAFDPWPISRDPSETPTRDDVRVVGGIVTTERAMTQVPGFLRRTRIPVVYCLANRSHHEADAVGVDELAVGEMAAEHLWSRGYRRFVFVGANSVEWSTERAEGFSRWLKERGAPPEIRLFPLETVPVFWSGNVARRNQQLQSLIASLPTGCGVFAANDVVACFVIQAARQIGRKVPEEVGVVGVDNDPFPNAATGLAISSIELPFREVGRRAASLLAERWSGHGPGRVVRLPPVRVVVRASTDAFMTGDLLVRRAQAFVEEHRHERITVAAVTRAAGSNRVTLGKHFQKELDSTLADYVRRRRLAYAIELLRQGEANVDQVADECGYSSSSYFSRVFKQSTGTRPGAIRRSRLG